MDQAEASGKTVEDALSRALAKLGASRDEVEFVVLDEGKRGGLFGRGARDATVRVERTRAPGAADGGRDAIDTSIPRGNRQQGRGGRGGGQRDPRPPARGGDRGGDRGPRAGGGARQGGGRSFEMPTPKLTEEDFTRARTAGESTPAAESPSRGRETAPAEGNRDRGRNRDRDGDRSRDRSERRHRDDEPPIDPDINAEEVDFAAHIVDDMLRLLDIDAELTIREPITAGDGRGNVLAVIDISGEDLGLLIGRRGDTLLSLQYLVNLIVGRRYPGRGGVTIDVEHYRHRREEQVVSLATRMADRVRQTGASITLEPMSAAERRLVHLLFAEDPELETNSIGEGENRKVVISKH